MNPSHLLDFLISAGRLKTIERTGWVESGIESSLLEAVADRSLDRAGDEVPGDVDPPGLEEAC